MSEIPDGWNQWVQERLAGITVVRPGMAGTSVTRDGRNQWDQERLELLWWDQGWQELVVPGIAGTSGTRDGRN